MVPSPRRLPHSISPLEGTGFELSVPRQLAAVSRPSLVPRKRRARCRRGAVALLRKRKFADSPLEAGGFEPSVPLWTRWSLRPATHALGAKDGLAAVVY